MEFVEGQTLASLLARQPNKTLPWAQVEAMLEQLADALDYAHRVTYTDSSGRTVRGVLHRDIKPQNIMITPEGQAKLMDFGIAREMHNTMTQVTGRQTLTPLYASPEQFRGERMAGASDVYSLASVLYECVAGHSLVSAHGDLSWQILHRRFEPVVGVAESVNEALARGLAKSPADRPIRPSDLLAIARGGGRRGSRDRKRRRRMRRRWRHLGGEAPAVQPPSAAQMPTRVVQAAVPAATAGVPAGGHGGLGAGVCGVAVRRSGGGAAAGGGGEGVGDWEAVEDRLRHRGDDGPGADPGGGVRDGFAGERGPAIGGRGPAAHGADQPGVLHGQVPGDAVAVADRGGGEPVVFQGGPGLAGGTGVVGGVPGVLPEAGCADGQGRAAGDGGGVGVCVPGGDGGAVCVRRIAESAAGELRREAIVRGGGGQDDSADDDGGGAVQAERVGPVRHARERVGVVPGLAGGVYGAGAGGPGRAGIGRGTGAAGRGVRLGWGALPVGVPELSAAGLPVQYGGGEGGGGNGRGQGIRDGNGGTAGGSGQWAPESPSW